MAKTKDGKYLIKYMPSFMCCSVLLEKWLEKNGKNGWKLLRSFGWTYVFCRATSEKRMYFFYSVLRKQRFNLNFGEMRRLYEKKHSGLKYGQSEIIEINVNNVDDDYFEYVKYRNKCYLKYFYKHLTIWGLLCASWAMCASFTNADMLIFLYIIGIPFVYALLSLIIFSLSIIPFGKRKK